MINSTKFFLFSLGHSVLIQSETCEEHGLSMPINKEDCQMKANAVGINDNLIYEKPRSDRICGCRAFRHKDDFHLHWNNPKGPCSGNDKKCNDDDSKCVCVRKGINSFPNILT